ncbi:helix-turn-helix transcriptional regulator [Parafrankia discariae]|uniref:helix-turn-helix transcriptional regulator n=1 Tax=Parafrankia discariae TaxID=365528 RepID=UPI0003A313D0|nr:LuxR family transcriptional regulator [Parafrankia discariae]
MTTAAMTTAELTATGARGTVRTAEHGRILNVLAGADSGGPAIVELTGDPGYGKTRLLTAVADEARKRGVDVLRGRSLETRRHRPFHPFIDAFSTWRPTGAGPLPQATAFVQALATAGDMLADTETGRCRLFAELRSLLEETLAAAPDPLLLLLDDVHFADRASVELLEILTRWPLGQPLSVVVAHRRRQMSSWLQVTLQQGVEVGAVDQVALPALSLRQSAELLGLAVTAPGLADLHERSAGNPLYLTALAERERGLNGVDPTGPDPTGAGGHDPAGEPPDLWTRSALGARLLAETVHLDARQRLVAHAAAVLGDTFSIDAVAAVAQLDREDACQALGQLRGRDLVRMVPGGELAFRHPLLGSCVYGETDSCWRAGAHRRALEHLRSTFAAPAVLARHVERSGSHSQALDLTVLLDATRAAVQSEQGTEAAHWLSTALRLRRATPETPNGTGSTDSTGDTAGAGLPPVGPDVWRPVIDLLARPDTVPRLRALGQEVLNTPAAYGAAGRVGTAAHLAMVSASMGCHDHAVALLSTALADARGPAEEGRVQLFTQLARIVSGGIPSRAEVDALTGPEPAGDPLTRAGGLAVRALCAALTTDRGTTGNRSAGAETDAAATALDALAVNGPDPSGPELYLLQCLGWTEAMLGRYDSAHARITRAVRGARKHGERHLLPALLNSLAYIHYQSGRRSEAIEVTREAQHVSQRAGRADQAALAQAVATAAWAGLGRSPTFGPELPEGVHADAPRTPLTALLFAEAALAAGDGPAALALLGSKRETWRVAEPIPVLGARIFEVLAAAALLAGEDPRPWAARAAEEAARVGLPEQRGHALLARGYALGRGPEADRCYAEAADLLAGAPAGGRARTFARSAQQRRHRPGPDPLVELTTREQEVAQLAGQGLRTRDIASRLRVSPRTVDTHLSHIYDKLGMSSRVELARLLSPVQLLPPGR